MRGTGRTYKRGNTWWIDYSFRGRRHRESSGSPRKGIAVKLLRRRLAEMGRGRLVGPDEERLTFEDLSRMIVSDYEVNGRKSLERLQMSLKPLRTFFGCDCRALDITTDRVRTYIRYRQEEGRANSTVRNEVNALRRALNLAHQAGWLSNVPYIPAPRVTAVREGFLEGGDLRALLAELPDYLRPITRFAYLTGWRKAEILSLRWSQVDFTDGSVRLEPGSTKNDEGREFPFGALPPLEALLTEQRERTRTLERARGEIIPWVFHHEGEPIQNFWKAWQGATKRAGLEGAWFHDLRRSAVRNLEKAGVPRSVATKLTGHKTEAVYRRYAIADRRSLAEGVEKLARLHADSDTERRTVVPIEGAVAR